MSMPPSDLRHLESLPESPLDLAETSAAAKTDSSTASGGTFISQVAGIYHSSTKSYQTQSASQTATQVPLMPDHNLPVGAQVLEAHEFFHLPDGRVVLLPVARAAQDPVLPLCISNELEPSGQNSLLALQRLLKARNPQSIQAQAGHQNMYRLTNQQLVNQPRPTQPGNLFQGFNTQNENLTQPDVYNNAPPGTDRGSIPFVQRQVSSSFAPDNGDRYQTHSNMLLNSESLPHPDDGLWRSGSRGPRDFPTFLNGRGERMQNNVARNRQISADKECQTQFRSTSSSSTTTLGPWSGKDALADRQQQFFVHDNMAIINQQQISATPEPVVDTEAQRCLGDSLVTAAFEWQLENPGTQGEPDMDDTTPRRPVTDIAVTATAPPKLASQVQLRSRKRQSMVGLNGSPFQRPSQTLAIDPVRGPPPAFYPMHGEPLLKGSSVPSTAPSVSEAPHSEATLSRASSATISDGPFTAPGTNSTAGKLVTQNQNQVSGSEIVRTAVPSTQITLNRMPSNQIVPWGFGTIQPVPVSRHLSIIAPGGKKPTIDVACDHQNFPFVELLSRAQTYNGYGVVRISNIPYSTSRAEIIAFLGRNAELIEDKNEPVHIIMDRISGKTLDAFAEFRDIRQAVRSVDRQIEIHRDGKKGGRLGTRFVHVEVSSQESMMRALFPKAVNVNWRPTKPEIMPRAPNDRNSTDFKGFINPEELVLLVKHVQDPNRIHFSEKCPQRPFECMISTIVKYPWYMSDYITIGDRDEIFNAALAIVRGLLQRMSEDDLFLNNRLLKRLTYAIFNCPGFTESQKDDIAFTCNINPYTMNPPLAPMADHWNVFKAIGHKPGVQEDVLKYYIALLREATTSMDLVTLAQRGRMTASGVPSFFGNVNVQYPPDVQHWSFAEVARIEWGVIDGLLRQSLSRE